MRIGPEPFPGCSIQAVRTAGHILFPRYRGMINDTPPGQLAPLPTHKRPIEPAPVSSTNQGNSYATLIANRAIQKNADDVPNRASRHRILARSRHCQTRNRSTVVLRRPATRPDRWLARKQSKLSLFFQSHTGPPVSANFCTLHTLRLCARDMAVNLRDDCNHSLSFPHHGQSGERKEIDHAPSLCRRLASAESSPCPRMT